MDIFRIEPGFSFKEIYNLSLLLTWFYEYIIQMYTRFEPSNFPPYYNKFKFEMSFMH